MHNKLSECLVIANASCERAAASTVHKCLVKNTSVWLLLHCNDHAVARAHLYLNAMQWLWIIRGKVGYAFESDLKSSAWAANTLKFELHATKEAGGHLGMSPRHALHKSTDISPFTSIYQDTMTVEVQVVTTSQKELCTALITAIDKTSNQWICQAHRSTQVPYYTSPVYWKYQFRICISTSRSHTIP